MRSYILLLSVLLSLSVDAQFCTTCCDSLIAQQDWDGALSYIHSYDDKQLEEIWLYKHYYLGKIYRYQGKYTEAFEALHLALESLANPYDLHVKAKVFNELSIINRISHNFSKAHDYADRSIRANKNNKDSIGLTYSLITKGNVFNATSRLDSASSYYMQAKSLLKEDNNRLKASLYNNLATIDKVNNKYNDAISKFHKANLLYEALEDSSMITLVSVNLSSIYYKKGQYALARTNAMSNLDYYRRKKMKNEAITTFSNLSHICIAEEKYAEAITWRDSIESITHKVFHGKLLEAEEKYKNKTLEAKLEREQSKFLSSEQKARNRQYWIIILALALMVFTLMAWYTYQIQNYKSKAHSEKSKYMAALSETAARMEGEQEERKVISSTLHDKVASLLTAVDMHFKVVKILGNKQQQASIDKASTILREVNNEVRDLSHQLESPVLRKYGLGMALDSLCQKMDSNQLRIGFDTNVDEQRFDPKLERFLYRASSELLNNVLKHSKATEASVRFVYKNDELSIRVSDNGIGIEKDTKIEGMGLETIIARAKAFHGYATIQNIENGARVEIGIPATIR